MTNEANLIDVVAGYGVSVILELVAIDNLLIVRLYSLHTQYMAVATAAHGLASPACRI